MLIANRKTIVLFIALFIKLLKYKCNIFTKKKLGINNNNLRVLIAPLDWGLGHTTRCIPIIKYLLLHHHKVYVGANETIKKILQNEFPSLHFLQLPGYNVRYSKQKRLLAFKILLQLPKILLSIKKEKTWTEKTVRELKIDLVISDNRFGVSTKKTPCIFITHQLNIIAPTKVLRSFIRRINYSHINRFSQCWVPDYKDNLNMAGEMSHPAHLPSVPVKYVGALSRFEKTPAAEKKFEWLIILSGPEPQRTILERKILDMAGALEGKVLLIRAKPAEDEVVSAPSNCMVINHLSTEKLQRAYSESEFVLSRSGYTTVMEVLSLQKKAVLIPTPGQTEQEYLAKHLMKQGWCYSFDQNDEKYLSQLNNAKKFSYQIPSFPTTCFEEVLNEFLDKLS